MSTHTANISARFQVPSDARFAVLASRWNTAVVDKLVAGALAEFGERGVVDDAVAFLRVPGAWELPLVARQLARSGEFAAIVALGCVVRGDTRHYEHVADQCAAGLMRVALDTGVPVLNGVLAVEQMADAEARAGGAHGNKGTDVARAALEMAMLMDNLRK